MIVKLAGYKPGREVTHSEPLVSVAEPSLMIDSNAPSQEYYPRHINVLLAWQQTDK